MTVDYDQLNEETLKNPGPIWAEMRGKCPVMHIPKYDYYAVTKFEDVFAILKDYKNWSSQYGLTLNYSDPPGRGMLTNVDPPEQTYQRTMLNKLFTPRAVKNLEPVVREYARKILADLIPKGEANLGPDFADKVPMFVTARFLGLPVDRMSEFRRWVDWSNMAGFAQVDPANPPADVAETMVFLREFVQQRWDASLRNEPLNDGLISDLIEVIRAEGREHYDVNLAHSVMTLLLIAGIITTTMTISNLIYRLMEHPEQLAKIRARPDLIPNAVEESLRYDAASAGLFRTPNADMEVSGVTIPKDAKTQIIWGSANRDPDAWGPDAGDFNIERDFTKSPPQLTFGYGIHFCLGAGLARMEVRIAMEEFLKAMPADLRFSAEPGRTEVAIVGGWSNLPVKWTALTSH